MTEENDAVEHSGDGMSLDEAAAAYAKSMTAEPEEGQPEEVDQIEGEEADDVNESEEEDVDDGEPEADEGQAEDEEEDEPETESGRFVAKNGRVRLEDGTVVTVSELIQGNLKERDYRQKTMSLADEKRQFQEQSSAFQATAKQIEEQRDYMVNLFQSIMPTPPDPSKADPNSPNYDPFGYQAEETRYSRFQQHLQYLQQQSEASKQKTQQETAKQRQERAQTEWTTLQEKMPELKDQAKGVAFANDIRSAATEYGFSPQEIAEQIPYDHRMALVLRDAHKWHKLQASKPKAAKKVEGRPPIQKGGKRLSRSAQQAKQQTDAMTRLKQTGSIDDAVAAFLASKG